MKRWCAVFLAIFCTACTLFTGVTASDWDCGGLIGALFGEFSFFMQGEAAPAGSGTAEGLPAGQQESVFRHIVVEGQGPMGLSLERTDATVPSFSLENLEHPEECTVTMETVGDMLHITVEAPLREDGIFVSFDEEQRQNVARVFLPDREYASFAVNLQEMSLHTQDFDAPMSITAENSGVCLQDSQLFRGSCSLNVDTGPVSIKADSIQKEIAAMVTSGPISVEADTLGGEVKLRVTNGPVSLKAAVIEGDVSADVVNGPLSMRFEQEPVNLYLDTTDCKMGARLPETWSSVYQIGNGLPRVTLSCKNGPVSVTVEK